MGGERRRSHGERIAVYAHDASTGRVSAMVLAQLATYAAQGFEIVFVSMAASPPRQRFGASSKTFVAPSSCAGALAATSAPGATSCRRSHRRDQIQELLLVNDSVLGPIRPWSRCSSGCGAPRGFGASSTATRTALICRRFSFSLAVAPAIDAAFAFFEELILSTDKEIVVAHGELAFSSAIARRGAPVWALYGLRSVENAALADARSRLETVLTLGAPGLIDYVCRHPDASTDDLNLRIRNAMAATPLNPTHQFGEVLVRKFDFPFLKSELLNVNPANMTIAATWRDLVEDNNPCSIDMIVDHLCSALCRRDASPQKPP